MISPLEVYLTELRRLELERWTARLCHSAHCRRCGTCCWQRPPALSLAELTSIATHLLTDPRTFFQRDCVVDTIDSTEPMPVIRRVHQTGYAGRWLPASQTFSLASPCLYLTKENRCGIHAYKPSQCRLAQCWHPPDLDPPVWTRAQLLDLGWDGKIDGVFSLWV